MKTTTRTAFALRRGWTAAALALALPACAGRVAMPAAELDRLAGAQGPIPVVFRPAGAPYVDCPGDEGERLWTLPVADGAGPGTRLRVETGPLMWPASAESSGGNVWQQYVNERTAGLRRAWPVDPGQAAAEAMALRARTAGAPLPLAERAEAMAHLGLPELARRFGGGPVLVIETTRFVLVGCYSTFQPWFDLRATLVEAGTGRVLWRDACGDMYPPDTRNGPTPAQLEANGGTLYRRALQDRAESCADRLLVSLGRPAR